MSESGGAGIASEARERSPPLHRAACRTCPATSGRASGWPGSGPRRSRAASCSRSSSARALAGLSALDARGRAARPRPPRAGVARSLPELRAGPGPRPGQGRARPGRARARRAARVRRRRRRRPSAPVPADAARYLLPRYSARPVETFGLLALDVRHRLRREAVVSVGCLTASLVHPREVFQEAVVSRAAALVLFHNHPSGDPEPSAEDLALTRRLAAAGSLMGIEVLDHLVLGAGRYVSLKERGSAVSRIVYFDCASGAVGRHAARRGRRPRPAARGAARGAGASCRSRAIGSRRGASTAPASRPRRST